MAAGRPVKNTHPIFQKNKKNQKRYTQPTYKQRVVPFEKPDVPLFFLETAVLEAYFAEEKQRNAKKKNHARKPWPYNHRHRKRHCRSGRSGGVQNHQQNQGNQYQHKQLILPKKWAKTQF